MPSAHSGVRQILDSALLRRNIDPQMILESDSFEFMQNFLHFESALFFQIPIALDGGSAEEGLTMKYIVAIIQPSRLAAVHEALVAIGIEGLTTSEVQGYGRQKGKTEVYRGTEYTVNFLPKVKIEIAVDSDLAEKACEAIKSAAASGKIGDGKVFVLDLESALRIRTGEIGVAAL